MKVLFLAPHPFYQERGTPIAVDLLVRVLSEEGVDVDLLVYHEGEERSYPGPGTVNLLRIPRPPLCRGVRPGFTLKKLWADVFFHRTAARRMREVRYDRLHAVEEAVFMARRLGRLHGVPYICDMDSSMSRQILDKLPVLGVLGGCMRRLEARAIREAAAVAAVCDDLADLARAAGAKRVLPLRDVPMPDDPDAPVDDLRSELGIKGPLVLYVGNLEAYQGIDLLLEAFAQAEGAEEAHLVIVGGAPGHIRAYRQKAGRLGVGPRTHFTGPKPVSMLAGLTRQADLLVSPRSQGGNTPMKLYSYMASGTAILATDRKTHTQVLTPDLAVLAEPDPAAYARALSESLADPDRRRALAAAARREVQTRYSPAAFRAAVRELYGLGS